MKARGYRRAKSQVGFQTCPACILFSTEKELASGSDKKKYTMRNCLTPRASTHVFSVRVPRLCYMKTERGECKGGGGLGERVFVSPALTFGFCTGVSAKRTLGRERG